MLEDHGLELTEIGFLVGWWESGGLAARSRAHEDQLYRLKERVGLRGQMITDAARSVS